MTKRKRWRKKKFKSAYNFIEMQS